MLDRTPFDSELTAALERAPRTRPSLVGDPSSSGCEAELIPFEMPLGTHVLARIAYGNGSSPAPSGDVTIHSPQLNEIPLMEVWRSKDPVERSSRDEIYYAKNRSVLLGWVALPQEETTLEAVTLNGMKSVLNLVEQTGYPHLLRMWNYIPRINDKEYELERYRAFCLGRHRAFSEKRLAERRLPAASAVGTLDDKLKIVFLASTSPGIAQENPRQISAYHYPKQYGPASPSFARATLIGGRDASQLLISGTASIVGHESVHANDISAQLDTILVNINRLIEETAKRHSLSLSLGNVTFAKVYLRHRKDYVTVREILEKSLPKKLPVLYLEADICRDNLDLEIEVITRSGG